MKVNCKHIERCINNCCRVLDDAGAKYRSGAAGSPGQAASEGRPATLAHDLQMGRSHPAWLCGREFVRRSLQNSQREYDKDIGNLKKMCAVAEDGLPVK